MQILSISAVQQIDSVIYIYILLLIFLLFFIIGFEYIFLYYTVEPCSKWYI